jgi:hypothetical protein
VTLAGSTVVHGLVTGDPNCFMLSTKKGTTYILTASSRGRISTFFYSNRFVEEADLWVTALKKAIKNADSVKQTSESKLGWLQKESSKLNVKQRYFILKNGILMWFTSSVILKKLRILNF